MANGLLSPAETGSPLRAFSWQHVADFQPVLLQLAYDAGSTLRGACNICVCKLLAVWQASMRSGTLRLRAALQPHTPPLDGHSELGHAWQAGDMLTKADCRLSDHRVQRRRQTLQLIPVTHMAFSSELKVSNRLATTSSLQQHRG